MELVRMVESVPVPAATAYDARLVLQDSIARGVGQIGQRLVQLGSTSRDLADLFAVVAEPPRVGWRL